MDDQQKVDFELVYFHGANTTSWKESQVAKPSVHTPVYLSEYFSEAGTYGAWVYPVFLNRNAKVFSWYSKEDVLSLKGDTYYQDDTMELLADLYSEAENGPWFNLWAMGHQYYDKRTIPSLKRILLNEMGDYEGDLREADLPQNVNDFLGLRTSTLRYPIYHGGAAECAFSQADRSAAKFIHEEAKKAGYSSFHDMIVVNKTNGDLDFYRLKKMMYADIIDALATDTYPISYMSLRRPLYLAIQKKGYSVIRDSGSDGENHEDEIVIIDKAGLDSILSSPIPGRGTRTKEDMGPVLQNIATYLIQNDRITRDEFERILNNGISASMRTN